MTIQATYGSEVRFVRSSYSSKTGTTITLALPDSDELSKVQGMDGKRYMLALVEIGDDEQPVQKPPAPQKQERAKGGPLSILAARWCQMPEFQDWIRPVYDRHMGGDGSGWGDVTPEHDFDGDICAYARHCVLVICDCDESRAEIDQDPRKATLFHERIRGPFSKHLISIGVTV